MSVRVALLGCGRWGRNVGRCLARLGALEAVTDANLAAAAGYAKEFSTRAGTVDEILADTAIDAVAIASPAITHADLGVAALRAGKHVFVEKPMAVDVESALVLAQTAVDVDKTLMVGHLLQYHPAFLELKDCVERGDIGLLRYVYSNRLSFGQIRTEENTLWSFAPHDLSMILTLMGESPTRVSATGAAYVQSHLPDVATTHLEFSGGRRAHVFVSWLHPYKEQRLVAIGERGMIEFNDAQDWSAKVVMYPHRVDWDGDLPTAQKAEVVNVPVLESEPLLDEMRHFIECVETKRSPRTGADEGLAVQHVLNAAQRSLDEAAGL